MKIDIAIASTTHIDKQNEKMSKWALEWMAEQINEKFIPQLIEHNFDNQIWILLYWEVFELPDWEFALWTVVWIFENFSESNFYKKGENNYLSDTYEKELNIQKLINMFKRNHKTEVGKNNIAKEGDNVSSLLEKHLNSTSITPDWRIYTVKHFIASTNGLKIEIYPKDHLPAHFHVVSKERDLNARFDLKTFEYISTKYGKITTKQKKQIKSFLKNNPIVVKKLNLEYKRLK